MPRFLFQASYNQHGVKGLLDAGAASRRKAVQEVAKTVGGSLESFDFAFGDTDAYVICDLPDNRAAAAVSLAVGASGSVTVETVPLLTVEDIDEARAIDTGYRPPGS